MIVLYSLTASTQGPNNTAMQLTLCCGWATLDLDVKLTTTITTTPPIMVTRGISSMETAAVNLLNAVLHKAVFYIISIPTHDKDNHL